MKQNRVMASMEMGYPYSSNDGKQREVEGVNRKDALAEQPRKQAAFSDSKNKVQPRRSNTKTIKSDQLENGNLFQYGNSKNEKDLGGSNLGYDIDINRGMHNEYITVPAQVWFPHLEVNKKKSV